jgi:aldehyde:ferredoxin oxidoreductase
MNVLHFGTDTGRHDWIPDRAIGPTDDRLYEAEQTENDSELRTLLQKQAKEILRMTTTEKRDLLMNHRKEQLRKLVRVYYEERGWNANGIPKVQTLQRLGLWEFLNGEAKQIITELTF